MFSTLPWKHWRLDPGRGDRVLQEELQTCIHDIPLTEKLDTLNAWMLQGTCQVTCLNCCGPKLFGSCPGSKENPHTIHRTSYRTN